jgi:hypothetical protein
MAKTTHITRPCEKLATRSVGPAQQQEIAALAYRLWLDRGFRNGSPQEDWLRAQRTVNHRRSA